MTGRPPHETPESTADEDPPGSSPGPPDWVVAKAKAAFGRRAGGELAALVRDTLIEDRDPAAHHRLRFEHPTLTVDLEVSADETGSSLKGRISPITPERPSTPERPTTPERVEVEFDTDGRRAPADVNEGEGAFSFGQLPHGVVRLHLSGPALAIHTDWFRI
jgi:hypothetical protein